MRIIDPHVHVWKNDPKFPWAKETINPPNNDATPEMFVDPETYEVRADGEQLICAPADELAMAQRYFLF